MLYFCAVIYQTASKIRVTDATASRKKYDSLQQQALAYDLIRTKNAHAPEAPEK